MIKRIIALVLVFVIIFSAIPIAYAASVSDVLSFVVATFGDLLFSDSLYASDYVAWLIDGKSGFEACPSSGDSSVPHQWVSDPLVGAVTGFYNEHCLLCGLTAVDYINALDEEKVSSLDSTTTSSSNIGYNLSFCLPESSFTCLAEHMASGYIEGYTYSPNSVSFKYGLAERIVGYSSINYYPYPEYHGCFSNWYTEEFFITESGYYDFNFAAVEALFYSDFVGNRSYDVYKLQKYYNGSWEDVFTKSLRCYYTSESGLYSYDIPAWFGSVELDGGFNYRVCVSQYSNSCVVDSADALSGYSGYYKFNDLLVDFSTQSNPSIVTYPSTTRISSVMQTINHYNVDNSVVDNSINVNYYISPKSYVTNLIDNSIDIEQCYSPQAYDEETLVFTEPVTGAQILSSGWTYNYETRTYDIIVPEGTTTDTLGSDITRIELIYGDDAVIYNYYLADDTLAQSDEYAYVMVSGDETFGTGGSSGDDNTGDDSTGDAEEETHKHSYTDTVTTEPTCEAPGIRKYTCDECGDSYTEKIDAVGHTWTVKQSVATEYDDTGAVTVQGYTIYKCSVCNTEYKDEAGTGPPNNSADNTDGEGIFKKIGQLLGSILSGLLGMIEAVLGGLLDGLVSLANLVGDKLTHVVEIVTGLFDKIPQLFGGFIALLGDVFVFIPEDIITIFTFGAAAIVFVGILMFFIKR